MEYCTPDIECLKRSDEKTLTLYEALKDQTFAVMDENSLPYVIGETTDGKKLYGNFKDNGNHLIIGYPGSGKSELVISITVSLILKNSPNDVRFAILDLTGASYGRYKECPHMLLKEPIASIEKCVRFLKWIKEEISRRLELISGKFYNVDEHNASVDKEKKIPKIVVIIDEFDSDFFDGRHEEMKSLFHNILIRSRTAGIYLVLVANKISIDFMGGGILDCFQTRICFITSSRNSLAVVGTTDAENLHYNRDCLCLFACNRDVVSAKTAFIFGEGIKQFLDDDKKNALTYDQSIIEYMNAND